MGMTSAPALMARMQPARRPPWLRHPWLALALSLPVFALVAIPMGVLLSEASQTSIQNIYRALASPLTSTTLWNTVRLAALVTFTSALLGTFLAWCAERTDVPFRRIWPVLLVVPFAVPDFVSGFALPNLVYTVGWSPLYPFVQTLWGSVLVMTLATYPLVFLPVSASLRSSNPHLEQTAHGLGLGATATFFRVTLPQIRGAIVGGTALVGMILLAEYEAVGNLGYPTFPMEIISELELNFNVAVGAGMALVLVIIAFVLIGFAGVAAGPSKNLIRRAALAPRAASPQRLGRARMPVLGVMIAVMALSVGCPVGTSIYWLIDGSGAQIDPSLWSATWHTIVYSGSAASLATVFALPIAFLVVRWAGNLSDFAERMTYLALAVPGSILALAYTKFSFRSIGGIGYQSSAGLVLTYAILFLPLAIVGVRSSLVFVPAGIEEAARGLGRGRLLTLMSITLRMSAPGLRTAFALVFISSVTELSATLMFAPQGVQMLSTQFWAFHNELAYSSAGACALVMIGVSLVPAYWLSRSFSRVSGYATESAS
jgi:iron(III) transport system permease protein